MAKVKRAWFKLASVLGVIASFLAIGLMKSSATKAGPAQVDNPKQFVEVKKAPHIKYPGGPAPSPELTIYTRPQEIDEIKKEMASQGIDVEVAQIIMQDATLDRLEVLEQKIDEILKTLEATQNK